MFSVAFGSTGRTGSAGGLAPFMPQVQTLSAGETNLSGSSGLVPPGTFSN